MGVPQVKVAPLSSLQEETYFKKDCYYLTLKVEYFTIGPAHSSGLQMVASQQADLSAVRGRLDYFDFGLVPDYEIVLAVHDC